MRSEAEPLSGSVATEPDHHGPLVFSRMTARNKSNEVKKVSKIVADNHVTLLLFSAPNSERCTEFLIKLKRVFNKAKESKRSMEIIYVPCGYNLIKREEYMDDFNKNHGDWWAMDSHATGSHELRYMFGITYIPAVVVVDSTAYMITLNGWQEIKKLGNDVLKKWFIGS